MSCDPTDYPGATPLATTAAPVPGDGSNLGGPYLVVSNEPESLAAANVQLYKCEIPLTADTPQRIRVFIWHEAQSGGNTFRIALKLGSGTGSVSSFEGQVEEETDYPQAGICCAEALLYNSYDSSFNEYALSTTEAVIYTRAIASEKLWGAVLEFDVEANTSTTLYLRTYVGSISESENPPKGSQPLRHIRGWWPYSEATFTVSGTLDTNPAATSAGQIWCPIEETHNASGERITPPELVASVFGHRSEDAHGWPLPNVPDDGEHPLGGNVGLYGAIVKYSFTVSNSDQENEHAAWLEVFGRNTGGSVFGAAQITAPSGYPEWVVPPVSYSGGVAAGRKLTEDAMGTKAIIVEPDTASQTVTVKFTAGGSSALPGNLLLKALRDVTG